MRLFLILLGSLLLFPASPLESFSRDKLQQALVQKKLKTDQSEIFTSQLQYREKIGFQQRLDSMKTWKLDIVYVEETYSTRNGNMEVKEYYFSSEKEKELKGKEYEVCRPDRYYEDGKRVDRYFFRHPDAREHLASIRSYMRKRKTVDEIAPLVKEEVVHAGCGMGARSVQRVRDNMEKQYRKPKTPAYYLVETFMDTSDTIVSFQLPVKKKYQVIVEGHSF